MAQTANLVQTELPVVAPKPVPEFVCAEVWGGNRPVNAPIDLPGVRGWVYSHPCEGGRGDGIPDECEPDCNGNGVPDDWDITSGFSHDANGNGVPDECDTPPAARGDMNCNGSVNFGDINPFVLYLSNFSGWQAAYPGCNPVNGDINQDGTYPSFRDINPFVALLSGGGL